MEKKRLQTYVLLGAVLLIWGLLLYQLLLSGAKNETPSSLATPPALHSYGKEPFHQFTIQTDYRDPFLEVRKAKAKKGFVKKELTKTRIFPRIEYVGLLSSQQGSRYVLKINGIPFFFKPSDNIEQVQLLRGTKEEVTVLYQSEKRTYLFREHVSKKRNNN